MFNRNKGKDAVVFEGPWDSDTDFDGMCQEMSEDSGHKVWWERRGDSVFVMTDSKHRDEVMDIALHAIAAVITDYIIDALIDDAKLEATIRMN